MPASHKPNHFTIARCTLIVLIVFCALFAGGNAAARAEDAPWLEDADLAFAQAQEHDRQIVVDLYADWCVACRALQTEVFPTQIMQKRLANMVRLRLDIMDQGQGTDLMARYSVRKLPTTLILSPAGIRLAAVQGFMGPEALAEAMDQEIAKYRRMRGALDKVLESAQPELQKRVAQDLHQRLDGAAAAQLYEAILASGELAADERLQLLFFAADAHRIAGDFERAATRNQQAHQAEAHATVHDPDLWARIDLLDYYIARNAGDCDQAEDLLKDFIAEHPGTRFARDARRFLRDLRRGERHGCQTQAATLGEPAALRSRAHRALL